MYNSNKIKSIFSKYILTNSINSIKPYFDKKHIEHINHSIHNFLNCGNLSKGFISYRCSSCNFQHKMKLTCKSRLCPSCGYNYSVNWTNSILKQFINIPHRHVLFTVPKKFRKFIAYDRSILSKMSKAINDIFKYQFHNIKDKVKRKYIIPKSNPNYFTNSDIINYGLITVFILLVETLSLILIFMPSSLLEVLIKNFNIKNLNTFMSPLLLINGSFSLCKLISNANYPNDIIKIQAKKAVSNVYDNDVRLFFNVAGNDINNPKYIIKYLGRYLSRVPIAEYKIVNIDFNKNSLTFKFEDLSNNKEVTYSTLSFKDFVAKVLFHLPLKYFKMINRYGFYARRISSKVKMSLFYLKAQVNKKSLSLFRKNFKELWDFDPFMCPHCNIYLKRYELFIDNGLSPPIHKFYN
ncbi:Putative transposase [Streptobacillus moniliformis]|nr:Putative transposase [Streptobacillus moniliformis]